MVQRNAFLTKKVTRCFIWNKFCKSKEGV